MSDTDPMSALRSNVQAFLDTHEPDRVEFPRIRTAEQWANWLTAEWCLDDPFWYDFPIE